MKLSSTGRSSAGLPAIQWWRHGVAAAGETSVVTSIQEFPTEAARDAAVAAHLEGGEQ